MAAKQSSIEKTLKDIKDAKGTFNLYDHLKEVLKRLIFDNPKDAFEKFEAYSFCLKGTPEEEIVFKVKESFGHLQEYEQSHRSLLNKINLGTEQQPQEPPSIGYVPNIMEENRLFQKVGVGIGEDQSYVVFKSLARLAAKKNAKQVRFWGKVFTSGADYYIAEGIADSAEQQPTDLPPDTEAKGTGVNKMTYWATNKLSDNWIELPVVTPHQIRVSRKIKVLLTGDLNHKIISNPHFLGKEAHLLKCQLIRITASSTIVPRGMYIPNAEDPKEIDLAEEWKCPDARSLASLQNWVHHPVAILKTGRLTHTKPEGLEPEEQQKQMKELQRKDPYEPRLKALSLDRGNYTWKVRLCDENEEVRTLTKDGKPLHLGLVAIKSLYWPGWTTVHWCGKTTSIYMGYGFKSSELYYPKEPEVVLEEQSDRTEAPEPQ